MQRSGARPRRRRPGRATRQIAPRRDRARARPGSADDLRDRTGLPRQRRSRGAPRAIPEGGRGRPVRALRDLEALGGAAFSAPGPDGSRLRARAPRGRRRPVGRRRGLYLPRATRRRPARRSRLAELARRSGPRARGWKSPRRASTTRTRSACSSASVTGFSASGGQARRHRAPRGRRRRRRLILSLQAWPELGGAREASHAAEPVARSGRAASPRAGGRHVGHRRRSLALPSSAPTNRSATSSRVL